AKALWRLGTEQRNCRHRETPLRLVVLWRRRLVTPFSELIPDVHERRLDWSGCRLRLSNRVSGGKRECRGHRSRARPAEQRCGCHGRQFYLAAIESERSPTLTAYEFEQL